MRAHSIHYSVEVLLSANPDANASERTVKARRFGFSRIDAAVDRSEEEIGAIAHADFEILDAVGRTREATDVGHRDGTDSVVTFAGVLIDQSVRSIFICSQRALVVCGFLMLYARLLSAK